MYIKALEQEVLRLKEIFTQSTREQDAVHEENRRLRELLASHGISYDFGTTPVKFHHHAPSAYGASSSGSISGSYRGTSESTGFSPPPPPMSNPMGPPPTMHTGQMRSMAQLPATRLDYDQLGIDFVLTYDPQGRPLQIPGPYPSPPPQG
jgi:hypothetical protein